MKIACATHRLLLLLFLLVFNTISLVNSVLVAHKALPLNHVLRNESEMDSRGHLWAILVAGSSGFFNYRHQADVCHAYQILSAHGVPDHRIIVMLYDDIAFDSSNPTKGILLNHPDGIDVYHGVPKDYTGQDVTPQNFLHVLLGNAAGVKGIGSEKVLKTNEHDRIFLYFTDHGATGLLAFPNGILTATQFNDALWAMHFERMFASMVIYIEACESGSMFDNVINSDTNIYVTTAASPTQSSYACYYDNIRQTYLGDVYSVNWMEDSDQTTLSKETLEQQFERVRNETTTSHVEVYGNLSMGMMKVADFQGRHNPAVARPVLPKRPFDAVDSREVPLEILRHRYNDTTDDETKKEIAKEIEKLLENRLFLRNKVCELVKFVTKKNDAEVQRIMEAKERLTNRRCYDSVINSFHSVCFNLSKNDYALKYAQVMVNLCEYGYSVDTVISSMKIICTHAEIQGIY